MSKNYIWLVVIAAVVVALLVFKSGGIKTENPLATPTPTPTKIIQKAPGATKIPGAVNYSELVNVYAGRRIQFGQYCEALPNKLSLKNGAKIMLDNRSGDRRTISVRNQSFSIMGYGYQLVSLTSKTLPTTLNINCGSAVNVGQILLQQ